MRALGLLIAAGALAVGCAHSAPNAEQRATIDTQAQNSLAMMESRDPSLRPLLDQAVGYVVFPSVKQGGMVVGGAGGRGVVFERGQIVGYADLSQASVGAEIGGQKYAELIIIRDPAVLQKMRQGNFDFGAQMAAVAIHSGAAEQTQFSPSGVAVFVQPEGGAELNVSVTGQRIKFVM